MARSTRTPQETAVRRHRALRLLASGLGVRATARELGCSPGAVIAWRKAEAEGTLGRWDRHGTRGRRYDEYGPTKQRIGRERRSHSTVAELRREGKRRREVPAWLTATRVRNAVHRLRVRPPVVINGWQVQEWNDYSLPVLLDFHTVPGIEHRNEFNFLYTVSQPLQGWRTLTELLAFQLRNLGFEVSHYGIWLPPTPELAAGRLEQAKKERYWPPEAGPRRR